MFKVEALELSYGSALAFAALSLDIGQGERVALLGPNGSGKTTFLKALNGLVRPSSGRLLFKGGEAALILEKPSSPFEGGLHVKVREENRDKYLDSMSGGEKSLVALMFIFAIQMHKAAPFYILDEADAALDKENSKKLADLIKQLSGNTQFIVVTHNDTVLSHSDVALGVTRTEDGSKIVGVQLTAMASVVKAKKA